MGSQFSITEPLASTEGQDLKALNLRIKSLRLSFQGVTSGKTIASESHDTFLILLKNAESILEWIGSLTRSLSGIEAIARTQAAALTPEIARFQSLIQDASELSRYATEKSVELTKLLDHRVSVLEALLAGLER